MLGLLLSHSMQIPFCTNGPNLYRNHAVGVIFSSHRSIVRLLIFFSPNLEIITIGVSGEGSIDPGYRPFI